MFQKRSFFGHCLAAATSMILKWFEFGPLNGRLIQATKILQIAKKQISIAKRERLDNGLKDTNTDNRISIFRHIVNSDMPECELSDERLAKEAQILLAGGTATTARTLGFISYYILANPDIRSRLQEEVRETMADYPERVPSWTELEQLPYLQALIKEGLR